MAAAAKTPPVRTEQRACGRLVEQRLRAAKSAALTQTRHIDARPGLPAGHVGGAVLAVYLIRLYRERCTRTGWLRSGQEASHRLHRA